MAIVWSNLYGAESGSGEVVGKISATGETVRYSGYAGALYRANGVLVQQALGATQASSYPATVADADGEAESEWDESIYTPPRQMERKERMTRDSNGYWTLTQAFEVEAEDITSAARMLPGKGAYLDGTGKGYRVDSVELVRNGNRERKFQGLATIVYRETAGFNVRVAGNSEYRQNYAYDFTMSGATVTEAFKYGYNASGKKILNVNTAGCLFSATHELSLTEMNFCYYDYSAVRHNPETVINRNKEKVCGFDIEPLCGKLFAESVTPAGHNRYRHSVTIQINPKTWDLKELQVGTFARFDSELPEQIWCYRKTEASDPEFVSAARALELKTQGGGSAQPVSEPLPLDESGHVKLDALKNVDGTGKLYLTKEIYDCKVGAWHDLPRKIYNR